MRTSMLGSGRTTPRTFGAMSSGARLDVATWYSSGEKVWKLCRSTTVTSTGTCASALAAASPPKPAPTITTCVRVMVPALSSAGPRASTHSWYVRMGRRGTAAARERVLVSGVRLARVAHEGQAAVVGEELLHPVDGDAAVRELRARLVPAAPLPGGAPRRRLVPHQPEPDVSGPCDDGLALDLDEQRVHGRGHGRDVPGSGVPKTRGPAFTGRGRRLPTAHDALDRADRPDRRPRGGARPLGAIAAPRRHHRDAAVTAVAPSGWGR